MSTPSLADCIRDGLLQVRVTTRAAAERIRLETAGDRAPLVRVDVTVVPEKGKANDVVLALLAKALGRPKSALSIVRGETARDKIIRVG